jgi:hypothetical protein
VARSAWIRRAVTFSRQLWTFQSRYTFHLHFSVEYSNARNRANKEKCVTPINIAIPESLTAQKAELETTMAGIASEEERLVAQRKDLQVALNTIATGIAVLSGQPVPHKKMPPLAPPENDVSRGQAANCRRIAQIGPG